MILIAFSVYWNTFLIKLAYLPGKTRPVARIKQQGGPKIRRGPHLKNTVLDVWSNQGAKREVGEGGHHWTPAGDGPGQNSDKLCWKPSCYQTNMFVT